MASAKDIRFDQRNITNTAYQEKYVSGSSLVIRTDSTGSIVGTNTLEGVPIGTITPSTANFTNLTASVVSSSVFIGNFNGNISGSNISASSLSTTNLTSTNNNLTNVTSSNISASGNLSASAANFNTLNADSSTLFNLTSSNISASGQIIATGFSGSLYGTSSYSNDSISSSFATIAQTANSLNPNNSYTITNLTASNISASGNTELGTLSVKGNTTLYGDLTVYGTSSVVNISSSTVIIGDNRIQLNAWSTGSLSQRYAGLDLTDSGSNNNVTSSFLWDSANNYWLLTNNQTGSNPVITSSALILQGPISDFGNEKQLPINTFLKVESAIGNLTASNLSEIGNKLIYTGSVVATSFTGSLFGTSSFAVTASYLTDLNTTAIISPNSQTSVTANNTSISASLSGTQILTVTTPNTITSQNGSSSFQLNGRISASNINIGIPNDTYPWGNSMTGSYFSTWTSDTNVSDALRFFAGAFSASFPIPSPNTKTLSSISTTNTNIGSTITINGRVPSGSTDQYINYLLPLGWTAIGQTIFSGYTFRNAANYALYGSTAGGSTNISSSLGSNAFGLGSLNNGILNTIRLSGSFTLTFASSSAGTINYTNNTNVVVSQSSDNGTTSIASPIALRIIPSSNMAVIPPIYQDGYFNNFTGSNLTNSISLSSISSSGIYTISGYVGINSGSSTYSYFTGSNLIQYYTPLTDGNFTQTISSPGSTITASSIVTRSLSGAPYITSGSSYIYTVTASNAFNPLYFNGTVSTTTIPSNVLGLTTTNTTTLTTNPTIQTANVVKSSDYTITRSVGSYPFESDVIVFGVTMSAAGTGSSASSSGSTITTFTVNNTTYNRAGSGTTIGSQTATIHTAGSFGIPSASGSLLYYGRPEGYTTSSLTFSATPNTEQFLDEAYRMVLNDNLLNSSGSYFNSASYLPTSSLQVKPGFLVNQGGANGYWYPSGYGTTYKYYVRYFKSAAVVNTLRITLTGNTTLVKWDETTSNSMAIGLIFESGNSNTYARCRLYDIANLANNIVSSSISPSNLSTDGKNPFSVNIDLYGNNGSGASNSGGVINIPLRNVDGMTLDSTVASKDELYVIVRYNGSPTPLTSLKIEKSA